MRKEDYIVHFFFFQAEDGIRDLYVTGVQTCALPICGRRAARGSGEHPQHAARADAVGADPLLVPPPVTPDLRPGSVKASARMARSLEPRTGSAHGRWPASRFGT